MIKITKELLDIWACVDRGVIARGRWRDIVRELAL